MPDVRRARIGTAALAGLLLLFGGAWLIGNATRSTVISQSGATSSLPSASVERTSVAVPDLPAAVALPSLAAVHRSTSIATAPVSARTATPAQTSGSPVSSTSQASQSSSGQSYTRSSSSGSSGTTHASAPQHKAPPPVVGGDN